ncbi:hypothetical protein [Streptomyces sp. NPDC053755]|uniref:hypothetical protein n=1 Tax=Streptomyces sp. NPDC053755 TaxID=3155815 RepID=UPI00341B1103
MITTSKPREATTPIPTRRTGKAKTVFPAISSGEWHGVQSYEAAVALASPLTGA